ncbi:acyl-CoA thioester hydrolase YciA [Aliiroseovarius sp. S2029]|uniref:acyl-CoA thioester hydrolase YciA n=1 Tax=Aliiroseovarius sp. S2029 TaxID=2936988 RepID=UPI0020C1539A|nr:acyl-CoA thioester hydrolase YciA [Aliiroseovarius sp. S2029]MCK8482513.1 acyl-CoA thioester hydrolase YciA [Aliiroseovarius sp. S2029]
MSDQTPAPEGDIILRTLAMPKDTNTAGDIFGGWVMSQMDIAGGIIAGERAQGRVATVAVNAMKFIQPVKVGDVLCIYGRVGRVGTTSMSIELEAWVKRDRLGERHKVTEGVFVFVALDEDGQPVAVEKGA